MVFREKTAHFGNVNLVGGLKSDVAVLKDDVSGLKADVRSLNTRFEVLESNQLTFLKELREQRYRKPKPEKGCFSKSLTIRNSIRFVNRRVSDMELDVLSLKQRAGTLELSCPPLQGPSSPKA